MIIGHLKNLEYLENAINNRTIGQALCFIGPDEVGKRTVAKYLAGKILDIAVDKLSTHSDFLMIEREIDEKKKRLNKNINIAQAKQISDFLQNRSWLGLAKVVLLNEAEKLNSEASNALLKTLEDAADGNVIILMAIDAEMLPVTIRSRCQMIEFYPVDEEEIKNGLLKMGISQEKSDEVSKLSWGRPGRAINFINNESLLIEYNNELDRLRKISGQPFYFKLKETENLFGDKEDANRGRDNLKKILDLWMMVWRETLRSGKIFNIEKKPDEALDIINDLQEARDMLGKNIHPRLIIERILLKI